MVLKWSVRFLLFISIIQLPLHSSAQDAYTYNGKKYDPYLDRFSLSIGGGLSAYQGELSGFFNPKLQRYYLNPNAGVGMAYRFDDYMSLMGEINLFLLSSDPKPIYNDTSRIFWSFNFDYFLAAKINIIPQKKIDGRFSKWNGAVFGGIGQVNFFPKNNKGGGAKTGEIVHGPGDTNSGTYAFAKLSVIYPVGIIGSYYIDKNQYISLEGTYRFTKTNFLDAFKDVSTDRFDKYVTLQFKYTIIFDSNPYGFFSYKKYLRNTDMKMHR